MKKYFLIILFVAIANMAFSVTLTAIVTPLKISDNAVTEDEATQVVDLITKSLLNLGVSIVDRDSLADILEELQFQGSDWSNPKKTAELGKILNAHIIIKGRISEHNTTAYTKFEAVHVRYNVSLSAINIKTAQVIGSESFYLDSINSRFLDRGVREFYGAISLETFACSDSMVIKGKDIKGFSFLEYVCLGKANFEKARKMAKEYKNGDFGGWRLPTVGELKSIGKGLLSSSDKSIMLWALQGGKPVVFKEYLGNCVTWVDIGGRYPVPIENGETYYDYEIYTDKDLNEEFYVYAIH